MALRYEHYITGDEGGQHIIWTTGWYAQTFTPSVNHIASSVKIELHRVGANPGTLTVSIKATTSDLPSGVDLCVGTTDANDITLDTDGEWVEITFTSGALLLASTKYAIVCRLLVAEAGNYVMWHADTTSPSYSDGNLCISTSGVGWTQDTTSDEMFEEWGELYGSGPGGALYPSDPITRVTSITHRYNRGIYNMELGLGDVISDFGIPAPDTGTRKSYEPPYPPDEPPVVGGPYEVAPGWFGRPPPTPPAPPAPTPAAPYEYLPGGIGREPPAREPPGTITGGGIIGGISGIPGIEEYRARKLAERLEAEGGRQRVGRVRCPYCGKFIQPALLSYHIKTVHPGRIAPGL